MGLNRLVCVIADRRCIIGVVGLTCTSAILLVDEVEARGESVGMPDQRG